MVEVVVDERGGSTPRDTELSVDTPDEWETVGTIGPEAGTTALTRDEPPFDGSVSGGGIISRWVSKYIKIGKLIIDTHIRIHWLRCRTTVTTRATADMLTVVPITLTFLLIITSK